MGEKGSSCDGYANLSFRQEEKDFTVHAEGPEAPRTGRENSQMAEGRWNGFRWQNLFFICVLCLKGGLCEIKLHKARSCAFYK